MSLPPVPIGNVSLASIDDLDAAIRRLAGHINAVNYRMLLLVREFDERLGWEKWGYPNCAEWLHWRTGISLSAAREKVRVAHALRNLPAISKTFEKGRLSYSKVRALTRVTDANNEQQLLDYALKATAAQVEERCRQIRNVQPDSAEEARRAWAHRALFVFRKPSRHTITIHAELPLEVGEVVVRALEKAVQSEDVMLQGPELGTTSWHAQQADALVAMAKVYLSGVAVGEGSNEDRDCEEASEPDATSSAKAGGAGRSGPILADHYQVVVHVEEKALRGGAGRSEMPIETVRRLACDATITVVTEDEQGNPLNVGRKYRVVPPRLRRALWARDRGCTFPGCGRGKRFVEAHHVVDWVHGGKTRIEDTALLCSHHHRLVHEGAFQMRRLSDGSLEFRLPDGRLIPRCGYRAQEALSDSRILEELEYPSAEAWLAALLAPGSKRNRTFGPSARSPDEGG